MTYVHLALFELGIVIGILVWILHLVRISLTILWLVFIWCKSNVVWIIALSRYLALTKVARHLTLFLVFITIKGVWLCRSASGLRLLEPAFAGSTCLRLRVIDFVLVIKVILVKMLCITMCFTLLNYFKLLMRNT